MIKELEGKRRSRKTLLLELFLNRINHFIAKNNSKEHKQMAILSFDHIGLIINLFGSYEKNLIKDVILFLKNNKLLREGTYIDVGANIGVHSVNFSSLADNVLAFEPIPINYELLKLNTNDCKNVRCHMFAISGKDSNTNMTINKLNMGNSKISNKGEVIIKVPTRSLDSFLVNDERPISLIKIDTEGHEINVLRGAIHSIKKNHPVILLEQDSKVISSGSSESIDLLKSLGYIFYNPEVKFEFRGNKFKRLISVILINLFGEQRIFKKINRLDDQYYQMIIAVHSEEIKSRQDAK